jgi:phosphoglycerate kinase
VVNISSNLTTELDRVNFTESHRVFVLKKNNFNLIFMKYLNDYNFKNKKALIRVDFNVPLDKDFTITDDTRLKASLPTIQKVLKDGGSVILMSHLGRPKGEIQEKYSLKHLVSYLKEALQVNVLFGEDCIGKTSFEQSQNLKNGEVLLLENLRFYSEETKGETEFANKLAKHGDVYVNDAFGTAHRKHASTAVIAQFFEDKICGKVMQEELANAQKVLENAQEPFTAIMGGAKVSDKIMIIEQLIGKVDNLLIGGGMAYTFFKAMGGNIGSSLVENDKLDLATQLIAKAKGSKTTLYLPIDSVTADAFSNDAATQNADNMNIQENWMGLDIGTKAAKEYAEVIKNSKTILWNGPMGVFEMEKFSNGTKEVAKAIAEATDSGAFSLIGGGDSAAAINQFGFGKQVSYVSTGGGALLKYLEGEVLPAVEAIF